MKIGIFSVVDAYPGEINRSTARFYEELLEQVQLADELGFDSFWIAEHHFHQYGVVPRPAIWLAAAAQRTRRIKLGAAVVVLPFDNPVRTAEDYAMVDVLSNGRLALGVGSGYLSHEFKGFSLPIDEKRARFDESLEVLLRSWSGERFSFKGRFHSFDDIALNVVPVQHPCPPLAIAVLNHEAASAVGERGFSLMLIPYASTEHVGELHQVAGAFHDGFSRSGKSPANRRVYAALHTHCAESSASAHEQARPCLERYVRTRLYARQRPYDLLSERRLIAVGNQDEIADTIHLYARAGLTDFLAINNFGAMPPEHVLASMKLLAALL